MCRISPINARLNLFLAVPWRGQSPFIENTARSHWETAALQPIKQEAMEARKGCTVNQSKDLLANRI